MKNLCNLFLMSMTLLLLSFTANAQTITVSIGSGTDYGSFVPIVNTSNYSYTQQIYLATEIAAGNQSAAAGMNITEIQIYYRSGSGKDNTGDIDVYLGNTTKSSFSSSSDWVAVSNLTKVANIASVSGWTAGSWVSIPLNLVTSFPYTGDNLVVGFFEKEAGNGGAGKSMYFYRYGTGTDRAIYYQTSSAPATPFVATSQGTKYQYNNLIEFKGTVPTTSPSVITKPVSEENNSLILNGEYRNTGVANSEGFKYKINAGGWQFMAATGAGESKSATLYGLNSGSKVTYQAFSLRAAADTVWGDMLNYTLPLEIAHVTQTGAGLQNGSSWDNAYSATQLQEAITAASSEVRIAGGEYTNAATTDNNSTFILSKPNFSISGAWDPVTNTRKPAEITTTLKAYGNRRVLFVNAQKNILRYLTVTGGNTVAEQQGAGIHVTVGSSATIEFCTIAANRMGGITSGDGGGAGIYVAGSGTSVTINSCLIVNNECASAGGQAGGAGVWASGATGINTELHFCTVACNSAGGDDAQRTGVQSVRMNNCILWGNGKNGTAQSCQGYAVIANTSAYQETQNQTGTPSSNSITIFNNNASLFLNPSPVCGYDANWANYNWRVNPTSLLATSSNSEISLYVQTDIIGISRTGSGSALGAYEKGSENIYIITLHAQPTNQGSVQINTEQAGSSVSKIFLTAGESCQIKAIPTAGYQFVNWTEGSSALSTANPYTLSSINASRTITANFVAIPPEPTPVVTTDSVANIGINTATINGQYLNISNPTFVGFKYKKQGETSWTSVQASAATSPFSAILTSLTDSTIYEYKAIVAYNTSDSLEGVVRSFTTLKEHIQEGIAPRDAEKDMVVIYPNPTTGKLTIQISDMRYPISDIEIYDMLGRIQKVGKSEIGKSEIDISHLPTGIYFLRVAGGTVKVVKE